MTPSEPVKAKEMIQPHELMIGNYVRAKSPEKITYEEPVIVTIEYLEMYCSSPSRVNFEPILLTEQWLLEFGFEVSVWSVLKLPAMDLTLVLGASEDGSFYAPLLKQYIDEGMSIIEAAEIVKIFGGEAGVVLQKNDVVLNPIRYVHQLQNLYWCLSGSQLTRTTGKDGKGL